MKAHDMVELAGRNLRESVLRNSLTTLGIGVGVASLVAMLSLGVGLQQLANRRLTQSGLFNTIIVTSREFNRMSRTERAQAKSDAPPRVLDDTARHDLQRLPNVVEVYPEIRFMSDVRYGDHSEFVPVGGLPPSAGGRDIFEGMQGKFFSGPDAAEAILQSDFARDLDPKPESLLGKDLTLRYAQRSDTSASAAGAQQPPDEDKAVGEMVSSGFSVVRKETKVRVVGIVENEPDAGMRGVGRARVFLPTHLAETMNVMLGSELRDMVRSSAGVTYLALTVRTGTPSQVEPTENTIKKMGFAAFSLLDATRNLSRFFAILDLFLGIFGSLALAVASLGIINTLVMAILERRREIGIMKAIGASDADVKRLFFAEAGAMGLLGGLLGVAMGWTIGAVINFGTDIYLRSREIPPEKFWSVPWWLVASAIGFSVAVSLAAGLYPAARAARLDPVRALRYE